MLSNAERDALLQCLDVHGTLRASWATLGVAKQKRLASSEQFHQGLLILRAEDTQAFVDVRRRVEELAATELAPEPLITGDDLIAAGMKPGPSFKRILDGVYDAQLEGSIGNKEQAMELARALMEAG
jgi:poly(A) polymerase